MESSNRLAPLSTAPDDDPPLGGSNEIHQETNVVAGRLPFETPQSLRDVEFRLLQYAKGVAEVGDPVSSELAPHQPHRVDPVQAGAGFHPPPERQHVLSHHPITPHQPVGTPPAQ